jgi:hypothetical protein
MDIELSAEQRLAQEEFRDFAQAEIAPFAIATKHCRVP